jgi:hypothetical protein
LGSPMERGEPEMTPRSRRADHRPTSIHRDGAGRRGSSRRRRLAGHRRHHDAQQPTRHHAQRAVASKPDQARPCPSEPSEAGARCHSRGTTAIAGRPRLHRRRRAAPSAGLHSTTPPRIAGYASPPQDEKHRRHMGEEALPCYHLDCCAATATPPHLRGTHGCAELRRAAPRRASRLRWQRRPAPTNAARMGRATPPPPTPTGLCPAAPSGGGEEEEGWGEGCYGRWWLGFLSAARESDARGKSRSSLFLQRGM